MVIYALLQWLKHTALPGCMSAPSDSFHLHLPKALHISGPFLNTSILCSPLLIQTQPPFSFCIHDHKRRKSDSCSYSVLLPASVCHFSPSFQKCSYFPVLTFYCGSVTAWTCLTTLFLMPQKKKNKIQKHSVDKLSSEMTFLNFINLILMV